MTKPLYTAEARVTGGREQGRGWTSDGNLEVDLRLPKELGGDGDGINPEQLFAIGYAACFSSVLTLLSKRDKVDTGEVAIGARAMLIPIEGGRFKLGVRLDVMLPSVDRAPAAELVRGAHQICPYSNAIRGNVDVALTVNGAPL